MKLTKKLIWMIPIVLALVFSVIYHAQNTSVQRFQIRRENLTDTDIPEQLDGMNILFFSDLYYGEFMNEKRLTTLVNTINSQSPDVVIFGGDLFSDNADVTEEMIGTVGNLLNQIKAPYGKFAVYGDHDTVSETTLANVTAVYDASNIEVLNNNSIALHHKGSQSIVLIGLNNPIHGVIDTDSAYENASPSNYVMTVCHTPDAVDSVPTDLTDYFLAGHSLGGQIYYFFSAYYTPSKAMNYLHGQHVVNNAFTLDITNGTGTTGKDIRLFANAEVVVYTLHHEEIEVRETKKTVEQAQDSE